MDYWTRLILATIIGVGTGLGISYFFGNPIIWLIICLAIAIATEASLRTVRNVKAPPNPILDKTPKDQLKIKKFPSKKPPEPKF